MKFSIMRNGRTCLAVALCVLASACNPDEYFPIEEFLTGDDAYCYEAKDLYSCQEKADRCQPAYVESSDETLPLEFVLCLANPKPVPVDDGSSTGGTDDGSSSGGTDDGSSTGGTDDGSSTGGTDDGSSTGGSDDGSDPVVSEPAPVPTLQDAISSKCQNLSSEYLWEKTVTKKGKVIDKVSKVKVCHMTSSGTVHTIVIACPALKAHTKHHQEDDYLGACY